MKIAVLTYNFNNNYGGMLQAYAMLETLKKLQHEPEMLLVKTTRLSKISRMKELVKKYTVFQFTNRNPQVKFKKKIEENTNYFIEKYITPKTKPMYTKEHFSEAGKGNYDAYLVGSDQVWRARVYRYIDYAFFGFVQSNTPIFLSYAASFGVDTWDYTDEETAKYKQQLQRFSGVSVREDSGVTLCKKYFDRDAIHVLDPTMLLDPDEYREIANRENEPNHEGELLTYVLDTNEEKQSVIDMIANEYDYKPFKVNVKPKEQTKTVADMTYPSVTSWLKGFDDAKYIITDSFHGCAFAILFNKPFIAYGNKARGMARFNSLLKMFGLEDRLVVSLSEVSIEKITAEIDWTRVNNKLDEYRQSSMAYLTGTLKSK